MFASQIALTKSPLQGVAMYDEILFAVESDPDISSALVTDV
jgi:hypothetical protein